MHANARLNIAYLLREQFEQLWDYADAADMRAFFDAWRGQLRGQDLGAYEKFAAMVDKHWDGIAPYSQPTHKIPLGFVEGFITKSASSNAAPMACATRNTSNSKSSPQACPHCKIPQKSPTKKREEPDQ